MNSNKKMRLVFFAISICLVLGGCFASSEVSSYEAETARAIIDAGNNICITIFLAAVIQAIFNK